MDMEAGIEHLGRATASAVDKLIVVVEPGRRSLDTAGHIRQLAAEIGVTGIGVVGNKIRGQKDEDFLKKHLSDFDFIGFMPYDADLIEADLEGISPYDTNAPSKAVVSDMIANLMNS
jgi:CO dehydrogenase maturation factor